MPWITFGLTAVTVPSYVCLVRIFYVPVCSRLGIPKIFTFSICDSETQRSWTSFVLQFFRCIFREAGFTYTKCILCRFIWWWWSCHWFHLTQARHSFYGHAATISSKRIPKMLIGVACKLYFPVIKVSTMVNCRTLSLNSEVGFRGNGRHFLEHFHH